MRVLDRKLAREIKSTGGLLVAVTSVMAVGVACYVALGSAYQSLSIAQRRYYAECRMADFSIELKKVPVTELAAVAELAGVAEIRPRISFFATVDLERVAEPLNGLVLSLPDRRARVPNDVVLKRGGYFTARRASEVIVNEPFARRHGLHPGQRVHLLLNQQRQELFIVGTATSSEFTYLLGPGAITPDPEHFGVFYIKQTFAEEVFNFQGAANQVLGRLAADARQRPDEVLRRAESLLAPYGVFSTTPLAEQASHRFVTNEIEGLEAFGVINPAIFLSVAAIVLNVLMSRLAEQQRVVVGTLKALGYGDWQLFAHFVKFALAVGLASGLLGAGLGYALAGAMTSIYRQFFEFPTLANRFYPGIAAKGIALSLACALAGSLHGARAVLRLEPADAMRPRPPARGGAIWLERFVGFWRRLSFGWRMTLRSAFRHRLRTAAGLFAAAMGACILANALMLVRATSYLVDFQFRQIQRSDIDLTFKDEQGPDALWEVRRLPGVDYAEPVLDVACTFTNGSHARKGGITGLAPGARLTVPRDRAGRPLAIPPAGLAMSRKLAELLHLSRGDTVTIHPVKGLREPRAAPVAEIADSYLGLAVYADLYYLSRLVGEPVALTGAQLALRPDRRLRQALYGELKQLPGLQAVSARADAIRSVTDTVVKNQRVFIGLLVLFAGAIFFGSVLNASLISLAERQREVATWRALGYGEWQVGGLFLRESMLANLLGTLLGLPLGYLLNVGITMAYNTDLFRIPVVDPTWSWGWTVVVGSLFALLAHGCVQWTIQRMDWLDALKTKE